MKRTIVLRTFTLAMCCCVLFSISACGKKDSVEKATHADTFVIDSSAEDAVPESAEEPVSEEVKASRAYEDVVTAEDVEKENSNVEAMERVDAAIAELTKDDAFIAAEVNDRVTMAMDLLATFVETGDVEKDSIVYRDGSDVVSFNYKGGSLGGVMITGWSADMNKTHID